MLDLIFDMLPRRYIEEWKEFSPWQEDSQVEQDLIIEKAILELFSDEFLRERLAFRGGTALHKLYLKPQVRYSEDIDLVQINPEPIKDTLTKIREQLDFLGKPSIRQATNNNIIVYRFESEIPPVIRMRLKIEINCREHFSVLGYKTYRQSIQNSWVNGSCELVTFEAEEILATKLRALYQRRKGRDLYDLYSALTHLKLDIQSLVMCYKKYMAHSVNNPPTSKQFLQNMEQKLLEPDFKGDIYGLLRPGINYEQAEAFELIKTEILEKL